MKSSVAVAALALSAWGCTPGDVEAKLGGDGPMAAGTDPVEWVSMASGGTEVTMRPNRYPVEVGTSEFHVHLDRAVPEGTPVSIDVVSLEMPSMGILRYPAEAEGPLDYTARAEISMEGDWAVYVNLGDGTDAASFEFEVQPGMTGGHEHGGGAITAGEHDDDNDGHGH